VLEGLGVNLLVQTLLRALAMLKPPTRATLMGWRQPADALINGESLLPGAISVVLLAAGLLTTAVGAAPAPQQRAMPCPPAATQQLDGFYRWVFTTADVRGKFPSQKKRFTPELAKQLTAAFALQPSDVPSAERRFQRLAPLCWSAAACHRGAWRPGWLYALA